MDCSGGGGGLGSAGAGGTEELRRTNLSLTRERDRLRFDHDHSFRWMFTIRETFCRFALSSEDEACGCVRTKLRTLTNERDSLARQLKGTRRKLGRKEAAVEKSVAEGAELTRLRDENLSLRGEMADMSAEIERLAEEQVRLSSRQHSTQAGRVWRLR